MIKISKSRRIIFVVLSIMLLLCLGACSSDDKDASEGTSKDCIMNQTEPQYYMAHNSAASENGYYYITGDVVSSTELKYLYFYDIEAKHQYPVCSKLTCSHNDETCDAHIIVSNIMENDIWYYNNRLYMIEKTEEYDRIISYDLQGRDRQNHTILSADGISVWEGKSSDAIVFNDGYVYYISLTNMYEPALYRAGIDEKSVPELIHTFDNHNGDLPTFTLSAMPGRVYVNLTLRSYESDTQNYILDYYDI